MNKIGILTGVLLMIFGILEQVTLALAIGLSLMIVSTAGELLKARFRLVSDKLALRFRIRRLERVRKQQLHSFQEASEWIYRFALRYKALVNSPFFAFPDGRIRVHHIKGEQEDGEAVFAEFALLLQRKGIQFRPEWLRIEINDCVLKYRLDHFHQMLTAITEERPPLEELLTIYVDEERRVYSTLDDHYSWNRHILLLYIQAHYSHLEIRDVFSRRRSNLEKQLAQHLQNLEQELEIRNRLSQFEKWLVDIQDDLMISISQLDQNVDRFTEFRMGIVYLLEKIGYRVTLPKSELEGIDLLVERTSMHYGVVIKPLAEEESISTTAIHEVHTARTLAGLPSVMLITNRSISSSAVQLAKKLGLICVDREKLCEWLIQYTNTFQKSS